MADKKPEDIAREWLAEYKSLPESSIPSYAETILKREEVLKALLKLFIESSDAGSSTAVIDNLLQPVCHQLFEFYRSGYVELKHFAINLFPCVMLSHIITSSGSTGTTSTDTLLLSIYALENTSQNQNGDLLGLEIPQLVNPSIYHDPMSGIFSEHTINVQNPGRRYYQKPFQPNFNVIIPSNRFQILTRIMNIYCEHIAVMKKTSHQSLCSSCTFLGSCGYPWQAQYSTEVQSEHSMQIRRRIPLGVDFILALLRGVYFALYNNCRSEAYAAVKSMQLRAKRELIQQAIFLCNAIINTADAEAKEQKMFQHLSEVPYGLSSVHLTPILTRENSRRGGIRTAATAKSIRDHKWRHHSEEISGDLSRSLQNPDIQIHPPKGGTSVAPDAEEGEKKAEKVERHTASPSKLLKSKLKKSVPSGSPITEKTKSPAPSGEKKSSKKWQVDKSTDEAEVDKQKSSPSQKRETPSKKSSPQPTRKSGKSSFQKQHSLDEAMIHSTNTKSRATVCKSTSDSTGPTVTGKAIIETSYNPNEPSSNHNTSTSALLEITKQLDTSSESDSRDISTDERSKESFPLLPTSDGQSTKFQNGTQQTVF